MNYYNDMKMFIINYLPKIPVYKYNYNLWESQDKTKFRFLVMSHHLGFIFTIYYDKNIDVLQIFKVFAPGYVTQDMTLDFITISNSPLPLYEKNGKILPDYLFLQKLLLHLPLQK